MYNLFVSGNDERWNGDPYEIELSRCVREYTDQELTRRYGDLGPSQIDELRRFPCIFAYEHHCKKDPKFGVIRDVKKRTGEVRVEYEVMDIGNFLPYTDFKELEFDLDISKWEMNRTHWALKNVRLGQVLRPRGINLPHWACSTTKAVDISSHVFDVALSFPGESRDYVESVALELEKLIGPNSYFYDNNYVSQLARPSLDVLLQDIYGNRSKLVVVFLCADYQNKKWCGVEFRAIRPIIMNREPERVMFVRIDDGDVDGVFQTDGFVDAQRFSPADVARFIQERVDLTADSDST